VPNVPLAQKSFWTHQMVPLGDKAQVDARSFRMEIVLILTQDRCTVCAERTIGSEIILVHPMELFGDVGLVESCFGPFGNNVSVSAR
jgi:hypothetical protein